VWVECQNSGSAVTLLISISVVAMDIHQRVLQMTALSNSNKINAKQVSNGN
jgi:hypothetical protein